MSAIGGRAADHSPLQKPYRRPGHGHGPGAARPTLLPGQLQCPFEHLVTPGL